jgi:hypothetical protein
LEIYSTTSIDTPQLLGLIPTNGFATSVEIVGDYAYVADRYNGLCVFNIADPANFLLVGHYDTDGHTEDVLVKDSIAYLADGNKGLIILDVSDPSNLSYLGGWTQSDYYAVTVSLVDTFVYLGNFTYDPMKIISVADPYNPYLVTDYPQGGGPNNFIWHAYTVDTLAYLVGRWDFSGVGEYNFMITNISDPANPVLVSGLYLGQSASRVKVYGNYAYINNQWQIKIADITDPFAPVEISMIDDAQWYAYGPAISGVLLVTTEWDGGFSFYDVSDPFTPVRFYHHPSITWHNISLSDSLRHCYLMGTIESYTQGTEIFHTKLKFIDITNILSPIVQSEKTYLGSWRYMNGPGLVSYDTYLAFGLIRVSTPYIGIMDVSDVSDPQLVRFEDGIIGGPSAFVSSAIYGGQYSKLMKGDMNTTPLWIDSVVTPNTCWAVAVHDSFAYAACRNYLSLINLNSSSLITSYMHNHDFAGYAGGIIINYPFLYLNYDASFDSISYDGFMVFDIGNPNSLSLIIDTVTPKPFPFIGGNVNTNSCHIRDTLFFLCRDSKGFDIWNVSNPTQPVRILSQETPGDCVYISSIADTLFVMDETSIEIYRLIGTGIGENRSTGDAVGLCVLRIEPNPFQDNTYIRYSSGPRGATNTCIRTYSLMIYDALGRLVKTFNDLKEHTGQIVWDGKDLEHNKLAQGVYFIELQTPEGSIVEKAVLLK